MIDAMILAAGESRRMGMPKPLLRYGDTTFLEQILSVVRRSAVDGVTVVLGAHRQMIRASVDLSQTDVVINEDYRQGQLSSLIVGLKSVPPETEAVLVFLADHPFITVEVVNRIVSAFRETKSPIVVPVFETRRGHPALFARSMFDELVNAPVEEGARHVLYSNEEKVLEVEVPDPAVLSRIDTPEDYVSHFGTDPRIVTAGRVSEEE